jgi:hypothetical protein
MSSVGVSHPSVIDLLTQNDKEVQLLVVEERALSQDDAEALQTKLNNYLGYALDGELYKRYPECQGKRVCLRIDLYAQPSDFIVEFVSRYRNATVQYGVSVELCVLGELVP